MANNKNLDNLKNKNLGKGADSLNAGKNSQNINDLLNNRSQGYGYGGAKPPTPPTPPSTPSSFGNRPTSPNNIFGGFSPKGGTGTGGAGGQGTSGGRSNPFGNSPFSSQRPAGGGHQGSNPFNRPTTPGGTNPFGQPQSPFGGSTLQNLKQGTYDAPSQTSQQMPTYKTPKQLREELKRRKLEQKLAKKGKPLSQEAQLQEELRQLESQRAGSSVTGSIGGGQPTSSIFGGTAQSNKPLSATDFFKQLEQLNKINTDANVKTDEQYVDERQQEILEQLERIKEGQIGAKDEKKKKHGGWFWIILLSVILIIVAVAGIILYNTFAPGEYEYVRISVEMTNPDNVFYYTGVNGERIPIKINPGDSFDLHVIARNSRNVLGDTDAPVWRPIFVRFKIWLAIDGVEQTDFVIVKPNNNQWIRYNKEIEDNYLNDQGLPVVSIDDGYYYYKGMLQPNQQVTLINEITFSLDAITEEVAGKKATLFVQVEVLEEALAIGAFWVNAPQEWLKFIKGEEVAGN